MANQHTSPWPPERKAEFARLYPTHTAKQLAAHFNTTVRAIEKQALNSGIRKAPRDFTADEQALIRLHYPVGGAMLVHTFMPTRNRKSINQYACRFKIAYEPWPDSLRHQLAELCAQGRTYAEMGRITGRRPGNVRHAVMSLGLSITKRPKPVAPLKPPKAPKEAKVKPPKPPRVKAEKPAKLVQPAQPTMRVVRDERPAIRFQPKAPCGKKAPSKVMEGGEKTSEYLKSLARQHPHKVGFERLTRPGQPRRDLRYKTQLLAALEETQFLLQAA